MADFKKSPLDVRWVRPQNIHLTVVFLGNVAQGSLGDLQRVVEKTCRKYGPFEAELTGLGFFGSRRAPRVLWVGMGGDVIRLGIFRDALQKALRPFGIKKENRPFRPHLTLGRFRKGAGGGNLLDTIVEKPPDIEAGPWAMKELVLFKSELKPTGPVYTRLCSWPLTGEK